MTLTSHLKYLSVVFLSLLILGCGWQLRGYHTDNLMIDAIALDLEKINNPIFTKVFRDTLANEYQVKVDSNADIKVSIAAVVERKRASSKDREGDVSEYEHTITLKTVSTLPDHDQALTQSFTTIRRQSYDEDNLLSSDILERTAKVESYRELARQYASYLARQLNK